MSATTLNASQQDALRLVVTGTLDAIKAAGAQGGPEGVLYAGLMQYGCTHSQFVSLIGALIRHGKVRRDEGSHLLFLVGEG